LDSDDSEFVRVEGRTAKAAKAKAISIEGSQPPATGALCWTESTGGGGNIGQLGAPTIRIEQSESPDANNERRRESLASNEQQKQQQMKMGGTVNGGGRQHQIQRMGSSGEKASPLAKVENWEWNISIPSPFY
jgi:hypothetical protein